MRRSTTQCRTFGLALTAALAVLMLAQPATTQESIRREPLPPVQAAPQAPGDAAPASDADDTGPDTAQVGGPEDGLDEGGMIPLPKPFKPDGAEDDPADAADSPDVGPDDGPPPPVAYGEDNLPEPVKRMRQLLMQAAREGDIEKLRPLLGLGDSATVLSLGGVDGDPVAFLKSQSGDGEGQEILAILLEVLEAGHVRMDEGTDRELYVWPYFAAWPLDALDKRQKVELFKLVTSGDYEDMRAFGGYIFYRVAITPEGEWVYFVSGD